MSKDTVLRSTFTKLSVQGRTKKSPGKMKKNSAFIFSSRGALAIYLDCPVLWKILFNIKELNKTSVFKSQSIKPDNPTGFKNFPIFRCAVQQTWMLLKVVEEHTVTHSVRPIS